MIEEEQSTPLLSIDVVGGKKVISIPELVNMENATLKIISTDNIENWEDNYVSERIINSSDDIPAEFDDDSDIRFYRLKAEEVGN